MRSVGSLLAGMDDLARLLAITLGPQAGGVVVGTGTGSYEMLTDSATVARRVTGLADPRRSAGAALLRRVVWDQGRRFGDGGATTAVLTRAFTSAAVRAVIGGADPLLVRSGVQRATGVAVTAIRDQARPVSGERELAGLLRAVGNDPELVRVIAEAMDTVGAHGGVHLEDHEGVTVDRLYPDGARFRARPASAEALPGAHRQLALADPWIALVQDELSSAAAVRALLEATVTRSAGRPLLIIAPDIGGEALTTVRLNDSAGRLVVVAAALGTPRSRLAADLDDLAHLTGATVLSRERGRGAEFAAPADLGRARWARLHREHLTVAPAGPRSEAYLRHLTSLTRTIERLEETGADAEAVRRRHGRLAGHLAVVRVGAGTDEERARRRSAADKCVRVARAALRSGSVPGGGTALIAAQTAVTAEVDHASAADERAGMRAVAAGLEQVFLQLVTNAGRRVPQVTREGLRELGSGYAFDTAADAFVPLADWPVRDAAGVLAGAVEAAGSTAELLAASTVVPTGRSVR